MIEVVTNDSRIRCAGVAQATGTLYITPSASFIFTDTAVGPPENPRVLVSRQEMAVPFANGRIVNDLGLPASFLISPTKNAENDPDDAYYTARFVLDNGKGEVTQYWAIDADGDNPIEITAIEQVEGGAS